MPGYVGLQLAVELTNILPVRQWAADGINSMLDLARDLRKSGSDIVVEEDLADVLGRGRVSHIMEKAFRDMVKVSKFTPLYNSLNGPMPEVELYSGPGPALLRAFQDSRYFTTTLILSMLGYYHNRDSLAVKLSTVLDRRFEAGIRGARPSPGVEGISNTIESCSSRTSAFQWAALGQQVEAHLRASIPGYRFSPNYYLLSTTVLLGVVDFLCRVQQLPLHRKISVSSESGCIVLILWAHHILDLTVVVTAENGEVVFGDAYEPQVHIWWTAALSQEHQSLSLHFGDGADTEQHIQLMDKDATVIISCEPDDNDRAPLQYLDSVAERHPLTGYCTTYLRRVLNTHDLTPYDDPTYKEAASLATALIIIQSRRLYRHVHGEVDEDDLSIPYSLEAWRIITAAEMLFRGILIDEVDVSQKTQFYTRHPFNTETLPSGITAFLRKAPAHLAGRSPTTQMMETIGSMSVVVLIFSHVSKLDGCSDIPLVMADDHVLTIQKLAFAGNTSSDFRILFNPPNVFHAIVRLLDYDSKVMREIEGFNSADNSLFLFSSLGWSVHLATVGDEDPSTLRPEIVHLRRGTPVNVRTKERKKCLRDGLGFVRRPYPDVFPWLRGSVIPKPAARLLRRTEYWSSLQHEFRAVAVLNLKTCTEWGSVKEIDGISAYRQRQMDLWQVRVTPACPCDSQGQGQERTSGRQPPPPPPPLHLGQDTVALVGWYPGPDRKRPGMVERIIVLLTCGDRHLRWLALEGQHSNGVTERRSMLRALGCCEKCALAHVESLEGKWLLIL